MRSIWFLILLGSLITYHCLTTVSGEEAQESTEASKPSFDQCKSYVDAALKTPSEAESEEGGTAEQTSSEDGGEPPDGSQEGSDEAATTENDQNDSKAQDESQEEGASKEVGEEENASSQEAGEEPSAEEGDGHKDSGEDQKESGEDQHASAEESTEGTTEDKENATGESAEDTAEASKEADATKEEGESGEGTAEVGDSKETVEGGSAEDKKSAEGDSAEDKPSTEAEAQSGSAEADAADDSAEQAGGEVTSEETTKEDSEQAASEEDEGKSEEDDKPADGDTQEDSGEAAQSDGSVPSDVANEADQSQSGESQEDQATQEDKASAEDAVSPEAETGVSAEADQASTEEEKAASTEESGEADSGSDEEEEVEEVEPYEPRSRDHLIQILGLDDSEQTKTTFNLLDKVTQTTLKELKSTYENAIKPLEHLYKYRDLSNRHFGDPEIFSKPLIVFMGPWSGGKSTIINWLLGIQHEENALRTGADPSPAQFNIMMYGSEPEKLDGTQLAADWTFSGLQKFGQSFLDRLRGQKLPNRLLEKVNIVEIPGILEVRKQVERSFPFNDACQWFIDRADTLFLIYDPAKLDIGPETEAILDQLKGRENQVRIVLNKADTVKPDELLRVQAMLVWNISPLMSSAEPPVLYAASLWDRPLQVESPKSLLVAHENSFLKDIRDGIERRVETRIAAARRFAVRVRNHAKMADCYLNTYNNHRSFFSDKKKISADIIDHPQNYHIYEGLSTLTNISRYDLPDPDTYRDFFRLNPLWDFPTLQSTCSFWRGCPLHKLDIAIAYDLPEILGKFRRQREAIVTAKSQQGSSKQKH